MNKTEIIQKIKQLEGLSNDERAYLVELVNTKKKYGLVWEDKPEDVEEQLRTQLPVLKEVVERRILAKDLPQIEKKAETKQATLFDEPLNQGNQENPKNQGSDSCPNHILIEGDNLHALTALTFTHEGQIDVMYFDPPYNTGNKDFKYNDSFVDREDSYRHSKWLSFMDKRLRIAKKLLSEKGVVFISIDDNEQAQLKLLCDEVFGGDNFIGNIIWQKRNGPPNDQILGTNHEHIYVFSKNKKYVQLFLKKRSEEQQSRYRNPDNHPKGSWTPGDLMANVKGGRYVESLYYPIINPINGMEHFPGKNGNWRFNKEKVNNLISKDEIYFGNDGKGRPKLKRFLIDVKDGVPYSTLWINLVFNNEGTQEMLEIFSDQNHFENPKPLKLILEVLKLSSHGNLNTTIFDFFGGSGTTLHATMQLNAEDGGNRQCILVTNNENNIAEEVCYERNRRVIQGYINSKGDWVPGLTNNNLRYYKSEFVESAKTEENRRKLTLLSTELLQIKEDCFHPVELPETVKPQHAQAFTNEKGKFMLVVYYHRGQRETSAVLTQWIKSLLGVEGKIKLYGFSPETEVLVSDFFEVAAIIDPVPLPDAIYNAYRNTFRTLGINKRAQSRINQAVDNSTEDNENAENEEPGQTDLFS